ncbi:hypothetical protein CR513_40265, partial [Mucuna pruriens]
MSHDILTTLTVAFGFTTLKDEHKIESDDSLLLVDATLYRQLVNSLIYLPGTLFNSIQYSIAFLLTLQTYSKVDLIPQSSSDLYCDNPHSRRMSIENTVL